MQYFANITILMLRRILFFFVILMVDPFASTNPIDPKQADTHKPASNDVFGGVPDIFADMTATAFQPIDPETGRPTEHTPETLDPFLRDDLWDFSPALFSDSSTVSDEEPSKLPEEPSQEAVVSESSVAKDTTSDVWPLLEEQYQEESIVEEPTSFQSIDGEYIPKSSEDVTVGQVDKISDDQYMHNEEVPSDSSVSWVDPFVSEETAVIDPAVDTSKLSDHYDPFVDDVVSPQDSSHSDDPFLQDSPTDEHVDSESVVDPFLQDSFSVSTDEVSLHNQYDDMPHSEETSVIEPPTDEEIPTVQKSLDPVPDASEKQDIASQSDSLVSMEQGPSTESTYEELSPLSGDSISSQNVLPSEENTIVDHEDIWENTLESVPVAQERQATISTPQESMYDDNIQWLYSSDAEDTIQPNLSINLVSAEDTQNSVSDSVDNQETPPSMVQWLVEGILDPFMSSSSPDQSAWDDDVDTTTIHEPIVEDLWEGRPTQQEPLEDTDVLVQEEAIADEEATQEEYQDPVVTEPTVAEEEQDMQKSWLSDIFVKFQELLQRIYSVHDVRGWHGPFTVVGADNDALYITYTFAIEASIEQTISITKEFTDRKDNDSIDTHVLRFAVNDNWLVEVYVDGVLLFVEDQLVDNVKAKMQLMDKFNKFIFLIDQFIEDSSTHASWDSIASAQEEFGGF